jgi:hypothetical protein
LFHRGFLLLDTLLWCGVWQKTHISVVAFVVMTLPKAPRLWRDLPMPLATLPAG